MTGDEKELEVGQKEIGSEKIENDGLDKVLTRKQKIIKEVKSIFVIIFCVFLFRSVFFEPFKIPSGSMIPTLMIGDFILVNKMAYGLKVPFWDWFFDPIYISEPQEPKRGDVVVFKFPKDPSVNYIKRVVGIAGDTVEIRDKVVYLNDKPIISKEINGTEIMADMDDKFKGSKLKFYKEKLGEHEHVFQLDEDNYYKVDFEKRTIPKGNFFVMGDNRDFSYDSRFWGHVPHKYLKGRAVLIWFSMIFPFGEHNPKFRPWRIGKLIE